MTTNALMELADLLAACKEKIACYYEETKGKYPGGPVLQDLNPRIDAAITQLRTAAAEGVPSEVVAYQWFRNGEPTGGWFDGVPSERQLQAQKQCSGVAEWTVKYAYSRPTDSGAGRDGERLDWVIEHRSHYRVQGGDKNGWFVLDCSNGLTFITDKFPTAREAIDAAIAGAAGERDV